jgi:hypothetical protein
MTNKALNVLFISFLSLVINAQSDIEKELQEEIWGKTGAIYQDTEVPEKWKNESAVILFQDYDYSFDKRGNSLVNSTTYHMRVALLDKNAVKEFSEFSFSERFSGTQNYQYYRGKTYTGFKIIKPDGTTQIVDLQTAVPVASSSNNSAKKIAIPDLQIGDIIDYFYHEKEFVSLTYQVHVFSPVLTTLASSYPAKYVRRCFEVEKKFYINYKPMNGAPELKATEDDKLKFFTLEVKDLDKIEGTEWMYVYRSLPAIKFQIMYAKNTMLESQLYAFHGSPGKVKSEVSDEEIIELGKKFLRTETSKHLVDKFIERVKENGIDYDNLSTREKVDELYHYLHYKNVTKELETYFLNKPWHEPNTNQANFISDMVKYLLRMDISGDLILTTDRGYGTLNELLLVQEIGVLLRVETAPDSYSYYSNYSLHPYQNTILTDYEGQPAWVIPYDHRDRERTKEKITLPVSSYTQNQTTMTSEVKINEDFEALNCSTIYSHQGHNKDWYQYRLTKLYDYLPTELKFFGDQPYIEEVRKKDQQKTQQEIAELKKKLQKDLDETLEGMINDEYKCEGGKVTNFEILKMGRYQEPQFEYQINSTVPGLVQKAGPNYLLNAGMLIGSQKEIDEKDKTRSVDVYMSSPRSYHNEVTVEIPEGYIVDGLEKLMYNVDNETGGFTSSAQVAEDGTLKIKTKKWYAHQYEKAEDWPKMLEFLEAAYHFTQTKILLKKG